MFDINTTELKQKFCNQLTKSWYEDGQYFADAFEDLAGVEHGDYEGLYEKVVERLAEHEEVLPTLLDVIDAQAAELSALRERCAAAERDLAALGDLACEHDAPVCEYCQSHTEDDCTGCFVWRGQQTSSAEDLPFVTTPLSADQRGCETCRHWDGGTHDPSVGLNCPDAGCYHDTIGDADKTQEAEYDRIVALGKTGKCPYHEPIDTHI